MIFKDIWNNIENLLIIILSVIIIFGFIIGIVGVLIHKKRNGSTWVGQGYGRK